MSETVEQDPQVRRVVEPSDLFAALQKLVSSGAAGFAMPIQVTTIDGQGHPIQTDMTPIQSIVNLTNIGFEQAGMMSELLDVLGELTDAVNENNELAKQQLNATRELTQGARQRQRNGR